MIASDPIRRTEASCGQGAVHIWASGQNRFAVRVIAMALLDQEDAYVSAYGSETRPYKFLRAFVANQAAELSWAASPS